MDNKTRKLERVYLDYAATTPVDAEVLRAMEPYFGGPPAGGFGNPSSLHGFGQEAMNALDKSREAIADLVGAKFNEIIFTSSATEANNLAIRGAVSKFKIDNPKLKPRLIVSTIEHESVLETAHDLEKDGVDVVYLPVSKKGLVDLKKLEESLDENIVLVSIIYANNETGIIQNISKVSKVIRDFRDSENYKLKTINYPLFHTDAVQAFQYLDCNVDELGVDLMTLSSHKIYGPKGAGALYVRSMNKELRIKNDKFKILSKLVKPILTGGGQEFELRSGTENVPAIVGFAKASEIAAKNRDKEYRRVEKLRDYLWEKISKEMPEIKRNNIGKNILPNSLNIYLPKTKASDSLIKFDLNGIAISAGSACAMRSMDASHVLLAMGLSKEKAENSLRITLGKYTTKKQVDRFVKVLKLVVGS